MIVRYTLPGVLVIGHQSGKQVVLLPECNEVAKSDWDLIKDNPQVKERLEDETLIVMSDDKDQTEDLGLSKISQPKALKMAKATVDRDLLKKWISMETRAPVLKALNESLDKVTIKPSQEMKDKKVEVNIGG